MSTLRGRERKRESEGERDGETGDEHEAHIVIEKVIKEEKTQEKMERTPRPEIGREWGRRRSVTGVSTAISKSATSANLSLHRSTIPHFVMSSVHVCILLSKALKVRKHEDCYLPSN